MSCIYTLVWTSGDLSKGNCKIGICILIIRINMPYGRASHVIVKSKNKCKDVPLAEHSQIWDKCRLWWMFGGTKSRPVIRISE